MLSRLRTLGQREHATVQLGRALRGRSRLCHADLGHFHLDRQADAREDVRREECAGRRLGVVRFDAQRRSLQRLAFQLDAAPVGEFHLEADAPHGAPHSTSRTLETMCTSSLALVQPV